MQALNKALLHLRTLHLRANSQLPPESAPSLIGYQAEFVCKIVCDEDEVEGEEEEAERLGEVEAAHEGRQVHARERADQDE